MNQSQHGHNRHAEQQLAIVADCFPEDRVLGYQMVVVESKHFYAAGRIFHQAGLDNLDDRIDKYKEDQDRRRREIKIGFDLTKRDSGRWFFFRHALPILQECPSDFGDTLADYHPVFHAVIRQMAGSPSYASGRAGWFRTLLLPVLPVFQFIRMLVAPGFGGALPQWQPHRRASRSGKRSVGRRPGRHRYRSVRARSSPARPAVRWSPIPSSA